MQLISLLLAAEVQGRHAVALIAIGISILLYFLSFIGEPKKSRKK
jgi:hypothetical protein